MELAAIVHQYYAAFKAKYATRLSAAQHAALQAILRGRTPQAGALLLGCTACAEHAHQPRSCGHRSCPKCQNHEASQWLERQYAKLLPVEYFMVTFTLRDELRELAWENPATLYQALFACASSTLADFGLNPRHLGAHLGMTAVLPKGFRRVRDYGFLHGNAKKRLQLVQLLLHVTGIAPQSRARPAFHCPRCHSPMHILAIIRPAWASG